MERPITISRKLTRQKVASKINAIISSRLVLIITFSALSIFNVSLFLKFNSLLGAQDLQFHLERIDELYRNVLQGNIFPEISTFNFDQNGSAVMSMYPKLPLYLFVILRFIFSSPITSYYLGLGLQNFLGLMIAYFSYLIVRKDDRLGAYLFSITYIFSEMFFAYEYISADLGVSFSLIFLPLVFAGFYQWLTESKYKIMTIGISVILMSHILNFIFVILVLAALTIINWKKLDKAKIVNLIKGITITAIVTSSFWVPALRFYSSTPMINPAGFPLQGMSVSDYLNPSIGSASRYAVFFLALAGLLIGTASYKRLSNLNKQLYWLSVLLLIVCSTHFTWKLLNNTPARTIQFPWRLYIFPQLFLTFLLVVILTKWLRKLNSKKVKALSMAAFTGFALMSSVTFQQKIVNFQADSPEYLHVRANKSALGSRLQNVQWYRVKNYSQFDNLLNSNHTRDYLPKAVANNFNTVSNDVATTSSKTRIHVNMIPNANQVTMKFKLSKSQAKITLPFVIYNHSYSVWVNGKLTPLSVGKDHLLFVKNLGVGNQRVKVQYHPLGVQTGVALCSFLGAGILLI